LNKEERGGNKFRKRDLSLQGDLGKRTCESEQTIKKENSQPLFREHRTIPDPFLTLQGGREGVGGERRLLKNRTIVASLVRKKGEMLGVSEVIDPVIPVNLYSQGAGRGRWRQWGGNLKRRVL